MKYLLPEPQADWTPRLHRARDALGAALESGGNAAIERKEFGRAVLELDRIRRPDFYATRAGCLTLRFWAEP